MPSSNRSVGKSPCGWWSLCLAVLLILGGCRSEGEASIAYLAVANGYWEVWISKSDGSDARQLTDFKADVSRISWFPDARHILVNLHGGRLFKLSVESGEVAAIQAPLPGILDAVVSPDGKFAAFSLSTAGSIDNNDIWIFNLETGEPKKLTGMQRLQHEPTWSRDGRFVYFLSGGGGQTHDIWRVDVDGKKAEQLTVNAAYHFDLAPRRDGTIAYSGNKTGSYDLWLRNPDGSTEKLTDSAELDARPSWSPDGKSLAFESTQGGMSNIWQLDLSSHKQRRITETKEGARQPIWSPTGGAQQ